MAGRVIGELWQYIDIDGEITQDAEINVGGHSDSGSLIKARDPQTLRDLAATACLLTAELDAVTP